MNFDATVKKEMEKKYLDMLSGTSPNLFEKSVAIDTYKEYENKRQKYYERLEREKDEYNEALERVKANYKRRKDREYAIANGAARGRFHIAQICKFFIFLLPLIVAALIGFDVFYPAHLRMDHIIEMNIMPEWSVYFVYAVFCAICLGFSLGCIIYMFSNEEFVSIDRKDEFGYTVNDFKTKSARSRMKSKNIGDIVKSVFVIFISAGLAATNIVLILFGYGTYGIKFTNGSDSAYIGMTPGEQYDLDIESLSERYIGYSTHWSFPSFRKEDTYDSQASYVYADNNDVYYGIATRYTLKGWRIGEDSYGLNDKFDFKKSVIATAEYDETKLYKFTLDVEFTGRNYVEIVNYMAVYIDNELQPLVWPESRVAQLTTYLEEGTKIEIRIQKGFYRNSQVEVAVYNDSTQTPEDKEFTTQDSGGMYTYKFTIDKCTRFEFSCS